ncbi:MAG: D-aminoacylase [Chloroflexota bacterium]
MASRPFDTLIQGGRVLDGAGNPWRRADVGIIDGRITAIGRLDPESAESLIDANDRLVMPGFVDVHAHSDFSLTINRGAESQVAQGITTEVIGNCGFSAYPRIPATHGLLFDPEGVGGDWESVNDYLRVLDARPLGDNVVSLVGHGTIRHAAMGGDNRAPTPDELHAMENLLGEAMAGGAAGMSTGLDYVPGSFAETDELIALCRVISRYGGVYASHLRGYTSTLIDAVKEAIRLGEESGCAIQLSHMDVFGRANWGKAALVIELVNAARERGVDVTADMMAYPTAGAWWAPRAIFPDDVYAWRQPAREALPQLIRQLEDRGRRDELRRIVEARRQQAKQGFHEELLIFSTWDDIYLNGVADGSVNTGQVGRSIGAIGRDAGIEPVDLYFELLLTEQSDLSSTHIAINEEDYVNFCRQPWMMFGTDSIATTPELSGQPFNTIQAHPRHYANFVRVLANHVRDRGWLTIEDAVRKMASLPATRFGLTDRGLLVPGAAADVLVVDLPNVTEVATWIDPRQYPSGIDYVLVNGSVTVDHGRFTGSLAGRPLRMQFGSAA